LRQRVEQLEAQLVDMQVIIGTLESLARGTTTAPPSARGPASAPPLSLSGADSSRVDELETQIRALTAELEQLKEQVRALGARNASLGSTPPLGQPEPPPGFGSTTVSADPRHGDPTGRLATEPSQPGAGTSAATSASDTGSKQLYETAYAYLLQRDYGAAEAAFEDFLKRHPNDPLAGNAQYWLGECFYVRGQYRAAANAFLKGYQTYGKSAKAPESLLKLAMSLQRLGQKEAACSSFNELGTKFPNAPAHVKSTAQAERQKAGC
jgi:tol-pal system protein YbgF